MRVNSLILWFIFLFVYSANSAAVASQCVILLHGLGKTHHSMSSMANYLNQFHYVVVNLKYPTTKKSIQTLANENIPSMIEQCQQYHPYKIHFVTHSMGALVLRAYLQHHRLPNLGRIVMLAPPNHGSPLADWFHQYWLFKKIVGPAGQELTTNQSNTLNNLKQIAEYQVGIIAGDFSFNPFAKWIFHEDNDGKVAVSSTRLAGMRDFIILHVSHLFITRNELTKQQVVYFLRYGKFAAVPSQTAWNFINTKFYQYA